MKRIVIGLSVAMLGVGSIAEGNAVQPTYTKDVAPILNANCVNCHRPGEIGPMSLMTFDEVRPWARSIKQYVAERAMPPWHADPGYGPWTNERTLSEEQIATIVQWVDSGSPRGNPADAPPIPEFEEGGWVLGEPDYIIEFDEVLVPADGPDQFYNLEYKTDFGEDRWITGVEIKPGSRKVVHHVILWQGGQNPNGWIDAWAAGAELAKFPEGTGRLLEKGATIVGDMHYHPAGTDERDVTRVGLHFAKAENIEKELVNLWIFDGSFEIPAGHPNYEVRSSHTFSQDSQLLSLTPHMHYRGKDFKYTATFPDGSTRELLKVSNYDFNWQTTYYFEEPVAMPKGTRIDCVAHFDNSPDNPDNPDPTKNVRFGNESYDEMMIGFADYIVDEGVRPQLDVADGAMLEKIAELVQEDAGQVWEVNIGNPGQPQLSAVHIPREGEGGWYILFNGLVAKARLYEIEWSGEEFTAKMMIPGQGINDLKGTNDPEEGIIRITMTEGDGSMNQIRGKLAR